MKKISASESKVHDATLNLAASSHHRMFLPSENEQAWLKPKASKILVVDDKLDTLVLLRELLSSRGYEIITATEANEAEGLVHSEKPDLVLLDVVMPGKSGYELCRELKADPFTRLVPVVMITGLTD